MDLVDLKVLFFGSSKDLAGVKESSLQAKKSISFEELKSMIVDQFGLHLIADNFVLAVNQNYFESGIIELKPNDEVAIIPPLSAG